MTDRVGHIPCYGECMACGASDAQDFEPCPEQDKARDLICGGYMALPASPEEFAQIIGRALQ